MKTVGAVALLSLLQTSQGFTSDRQNLGYYSFGFDNPGKCATTLLDEISGSWVPVRVLQWKRPDAEGDVLIAAGFRLRNSRGPQVNISYAFARSFDAGLTWECFQGRGHSAEPYGPAPLEPGAPSTALTVSQFIAYQAVRPLGATFSVQQGSCSLACVAGGSPPSTYGFHQNGVVCTKGNMQTFFLAASLPVVSPGLGAPYAVTYKGQALIFINTFADVQVFRAVIDTGRCNITDWEPYLPMGVVSLGARGGATVVSVYDSAIESERLYLAGGFLPSPAGPSRVWDLWSWTERENPNNTSNSFVQVLHTLPLPVEPPLTYTMDASELSDAFRLLPVLNGALDMHEDSQENAIIWQAGQDMWRIANLSTGVSKPPSVTRVRMRWWKRPNPSGGYMNATVLRQTAPGVLLMATPVFNPRDFVPYYAFTELPLPLNAGGSVQEQHSQFTPPAAYGRMTNVPCLNKCKMQGMYTTAPTVRSSGCEQGPTDATCTACTSCKLGERALSACGDGDHESGGENPLCAPVDFLLQITPKSAEASAVSSFAVAAGCLGALCSLVLVVGKSRGSEPSTSLYLWCTVTVLVACSYAAAWACQAAISLALLHSTVDAEVVSTAFVSVPTGKDAAPFRELVGSAARLPSACATILIISLSLDMAVGVARATSALLDSSGRRSLNDGAGWPSMVGHAIQLIEVASPLASAILKNGIAASTQQASKEGASPSTGPDPLIVFFVVTDAVRFVVLCLLYLTAPLTAVGVRMISTGLALTGCSLLLASTMLIALTARVHNSLCFRKMFGSPSPSGGSSSTPQGATATGVSVGRLLPALPAIEMGKAGAPTKNNGYGLGVVVLNPLSMAAENSHSGRPLHLPAAEHAPSAVPNDRASRVQHVFAIGAAEDPKHDSRVPVLYGAAPSPSPYHHEMPAGSGLYHGAAFHPSPSPPAHEVAMVGSGAAQDVNHGGDEAELGEDGRPKSLSWEMVRVIARPGDAASAQGVQGEVLDTARGECTSPRDERRSAEVVMVAGPLARAQGGSDTDSFGMGSFGHDVQM